MQIHCQFITELFMILFHKKIFFNCSHCKKFSCNLKKRNFHPWSISTLSKLRKEDSTPVEEAFSFYQCEIQYIASPNTDLPCLTHCPGEKTY